MASTIILFTFFLIEHDESKKEAAWMIFLHKQLKNKIKNFFDESNWKLKLNQWLKLKF